MEIDDKEKVRKLYKELTNSPDKEIAQQIRSIPIEKFVSRFLEDTEIGSNARSDVYQAVIDTREDFIDYDDWIAGYAPKFASSLPIETPPKKKDGGSFGVPDAGVVPTEEQLTLEDYQRKDSIIPLLPTEEMRPKEFTPNFNQFQNEKALQQSAQSPAFKDYSIAKGVLEDREKLYQDSPLIENQNEFGRWDVQQFSADGNEVINTLGTYDTREQAQKAIRANRRQAAPSGLIFPFKDDEKGYNQAESEKRIAENEKIRQGAKLKTVGMAEAIYERGKKLVKDLGQGAFYALSARTRMSPLYPGADEMIKKKIFQESEKIDVEFSKALTDSGIETSVLDAVRKGEYEKIPEATLYTIGDVAMQIIPAWFTYGSSTYLQTIANAYKNGVNEVAKAKGITPEQVIDSGDDKEILANASTLIVSGLDLLGAKLVPKAIAGKGAYAAIRDGILKVIGGKGGLKQTAAAAGGVAGSSLLETGTELGQEVTAIAQEALAGGGDIKGAMKLLTERYENGEIPERLYQTAVNALVGTSGLVVGGRAIKKAIGGETQDAAQVQQEPAQPAPNAFEGAQTPQQAAAAVVATPTATDPAEAALNNALETGDTSQLTPEQLEVYEEMGGVMPQADVVKRQTAARIDAFVNLASNPETDLYELYDDAANSDLPDADKQTLLNLIDDELILRERNESKAEETVATTPEGAAITSVGNIVIQPEIKARTVDVTADRYEGVTGDINGQQGTFTATEDGHVDFVTEQGETIQLDGGRIGFVETIKDENGTVVGVVLADAVSGLKINVNDSEIALDLATLAMQDQLAKVEISDGEFNAAIQQVSTTLAANETAATDQTVVSQTADTGSQPQQSANVVEVDTPAMQTEQEVDQVVGGEVGTAENLGSKKASLDEKAKKLGYSGVKQFNTQNLLNENLSDEEKALLQEYSDFQQEVKSLTDEEVIAKLSDDEFSTWKKANDIQRNDLGKVIRDDDIEFAAKRIRILQARGDSKSADAELKKLKDSKKKDNWTVESWKERFDEDIDQSEIDETNQSNKVFNDLLDKAVKSFDSKQESPSQLGQEVGQPTETVESVDEEGSVGVGGDAKTRKGEKQIKAAFEKLDESKTAEEKLNAINLLELNEREGAELTKEEKQKIQKTKDNLLADGYETPELLGKQFNQGMKVIVESLIPDETLALGEEVITRIIEPQINKNDKMVQTARIRVTVGTKKGGLSRQEWLSKQKTETPKAKAGNADFNKGDKVVWEGKDRTIISATKIGNEVKYEIDLGGGKSIWTNAMTLESERAKATQPTPTQTTPAPAKAATPKAGSVGVGGEVVKEPMSDNELQQLVGRDVFKQIQRSEEQLGEGVVDRNRMIETAKRIQKADKKDKLLPEHIFEALQYETGFPDNWQDLRNAIKKGGIDINSEAIQRQIEVGVDLPKDIVEEFKKSERYKKATPELVKAVEQSLKETPTPEKQPRRPAPPKPEGGQEAQTEIGGIKFDKNGVAKAVPIKGVIEKIEKTMGINGIFKIYTLSTQYGVQIEVYGDIDSNFVDGKLVEGSEVSFTTNVKYIGTNQTKSNFGKPILKTVGPKTEYKQPKPAATKKEEKLAPAAQPAPPKGEGATILPSVDADKADAQLYILQRNNYYTLWYNRKQVDEKTGKTLWSYSNYLTILSQDLDNARTKALDYLNKIASGEFLSTAFVGKNTQGLEDVKTIALQEGVLTPETQPISKSKTLGVEKTFGIGKYSNLTIDELLDKDLDYAQWFVNNYTSRGADQTKAIIKGDPRYQDYLNIKRDIEELEKARIEAYEAREAERKAGGKVKVATLVRGEEGEIKEVIEETEVPKKKVEKKEQRLVKDQITNIVAPQANAKDKVDSNLKPQMFAAQINGANTAIASLDKYGVVLNGDGAGVGKTRQIIAVAKHYADSGKPVVIISENAALGKPFEGGKKPALGGSMAKDSEAMGVSLTLLTDDKKVQPSGIYVSTYNRIQDADVPDGAIVIFDESHNLVNTFGRTPSGEEIEEERQWEAKFRPMLKKAGAVAYYTATPADKPHQLAYLYKVLGFNSPEDFLSEMMLNGAVIKERKFGRIKIKYYDVPNSKTRRADLYKWVNGLMIKAGEQGRFIKREISYEGTDVQFQDIKGTDESKNEYAKEFNKVLDDMSDAEMMNYRLLAPNSYILYAAELSKIGEAINIIKKQLAQGRKSIIFVSRINPMEIRGRKEGFGGELGDPEVLGEIPSPVPMLEEALKKEGIKFVGLHSKAKTTSQKAQKQFAEEADVLIASLESGGTGINLDDTVGDNPRTEVFLFSPYRGISTIQGMGRIWRASTIQNDNNPNRYVFVTASDISPDLKRSSVLAKKLQLMNAAIGGTAVSKLPMSKVSYSSEELVGIELPDDTDEESAIFKEKTGILKPVNIDWKQSRKGGYYANASADLLEWMERGGPDRTGLDVRVFKSEDGKWVALAGKDYKAEEFAPENIVNEPAPTETPTPEKQPRRPAPPKPEAGQEAATLAEALKIDEEEAIRVLLNFGRKPDKAFQALLKTPESELADYLSDDQMALLPKLQEYSKQFGGKRKTVVEKMADLEKNIQANNLFEATRLATQWAYLNIAYYGPKAAKAAKRKLHETLKSAGVEAKKAAEIVVKAFQNATEALRKATINWLDGQIADINEMNKGGNAYSGTDFGTNKLWLAGFKALRNAMLSKNANLEAELDKFDATLKRAGVTAKTIEEYKIAYREAVIAGEVGTPKAKTVVNKLTGVNKGADYKKAMADLKLQLTVSIEGAKLQDRAKAFTTFLDGMAGINAITAQQAKKIFRQYASAIISDKGLQKAIAFAEKVADDAEFETAVSAAKSAYNSIKKGSPRYSPVDNSFAASLPAIDFASLEKEELQALAEQMKAWKKAKVSGTAASTNALKAALEAAAQKAPIEPTVVTVDKTEGDPQADKDEKAPIIEAIKTTLADLEPAATPMTQQALDGLKKQDLTWLSKTQLIQLANSIAAYQETGVLAGASDLLQQAKAKQNTSGLGQTWATIVGLMRRMPFYGKNRNVDGTAAKQTMASFTTLFQTIKADAAKIRAAIMPWEQKIGRVLSAHKLFQLEVFEKVNKLALTDEDKYIAGAYGFLAENSGNSQPFEVKLKAVAAELSKAGVLLHKKIGTLKRKGSNQDLRNQKRVNNDAKALEALGLVDLDYIGKDVVSVRPRQDASLKKMQEAFNANQKAKQFYDYSQQKFAEGSAAYFESLALNFGKLAEPIEGYQHRMFIPLEMKDVSKALPDDFGMGFGFGGAASDVTGTNKGRTELGTQGIYDFNLENLLLNGIWDMKLTSELGSEYAYEKAILNSPQGLASFVKSKPEYNKFREYLVSRITGNIDAGYFMDDETSLAKGVGQSVSRNVAKTVVGNISQLAKQTPSLFYLATYNPKAFVKAEKIIVKYTAETTKMQLGLAYNEELVEAFNTFLQSTTYPFRTNLGYIELAQELTKENKYSRTLTVATDAIDKYTGGKVVQSMDKLITATALLTGYIEKTGNSDLVAENKKGFNAEGLAAGENVAEQSNSVSDPSALSTEFKERDSIDRFLRSMVAVTTNAFWQNIKVVGDSAMPIESRNMAARHALSYLGMTASFAIVSKMAGEAMVAGSFALINAVSDMVGSDLYLSKDGEDEEEKEFKNQLSYARKTMEVFMTVLFGTYGNYADAIIRAGIEGSFALIRAYRYNEAKKEDTREGTKKEVLSMPQGQVDFAPILFPEMPMGAYGVPYDMVMSIAQSALRKNMETEFPWILGQMAALRLGLGTPYSIVSYGKRGMSAPAKGSDLQEFKKENSREYVRWVQSMRKEGLKDKDLGKFVFKGVLDQRIILTPAQAKQYMESYNNNLKKLEPVYETLVSFYEKSGEEAPKRKSQLEIEEQANTFAQIPFLAQ